MNRRDFLKFSGVGFASLAMPPFQSSPVICISTQADFDALMNNATIPPGSIIVLQGSFTGNKVPRFAGTLEQPITLIGSNFHLDGSFYINTPHTHWINLHITAPVDRYTFYTSREGTELSYSDLAGGHIGIGWFGSGVGAIQNCTIHNTASYGLYTHNHVGGLRTILNTTFTNIGGYYGMHFYSDANRVRDYVVAGCVVDKPTIVHSGVEVSNANFVSNTFNAWVKVGNSQSASDIRQAVFTKNRFAGSQSGLTIISVSEMEVTGNEFDIIGTPAQDTNIYLMPGQNQKRLVVDGNHYVGGNFNLNNSIKNFAQWQAAGYDPNGVYI